MSFGKRVARFRKRAIKATDDTRRAIIIELFSSVILDTPVDTGRARGNWQTSTNTPKRAELNRKDKPGTAAIAEIEANLGKPGSTVYLANNLPYIVDLEYGSSKQAPKGMVRKNVARVRTIIRKQAQQHRI